MTSQGIAYMDLLEQSRHNVQTEINATRMTGETIRSNKVREKETSKHNRATEKQARKELKETTRSHKKNEKENSRSHRAQERENVRSHKATESITKGFNQGKLRLGDRELAELIRSHKANEANQSVQSRASLLQAYAARRQASAASSQARSAAKNARINKYKSRTERQDVKNRRKSQEENVAAKYNDTYVKSVIENNKLKQADKRLEYNRSIEDLNRTSREGVAGMQSLLSLAESFVRSGLMSSKK